MLKSAIGAFVRAAVKVHARVIRSTRLPILIAAFALVGAASAQAGVTWRSTSATTSGGTVATGGTLTAGINFSADMGIDCDAINKVELRKGSTVLSYRNYSVSYTGCGGGDPLNALRTGTLSTSLGVGVHQIYLRAYSVYRDQGDSPTYTVTVTQANNAAFVSQSVPTTMLVGQTYNVSVTMSNTGANTWTSASGYKLGSQNPQDNATWGSGRVNLDASVAPNTQKAFAFAVTAPSTAGTYNFQWRMVQDGVEWFGGTSPNVAVNVVHPQPTISVQRTPSPMVAGENYTLSWSSTNATSVSYNCTSTGSGFVGSATLAASGTSNGVASSAWVGYPSTCTWTATGPGGSQTYTETMTTVAPTHNAQFVSQSVPSVVTAGQSYVVSVTMRNTGNGTWTSGTTFRLGSQNPQDNTIWGVNRVSLDASVAPNAQKTFTFTARAPSGAGTYNFQWRMVQEGVQWFGGTSSNVAVAVVSPDTAIPVALTPPHLGNPDAGTLPGSLSVSNSGAATYSIPIDVPPGTAGLQPKLSLNYSSQGTNGQIGLGWSLGGFSSVHRCGKTIAQDGVNGRIRFDQGDRLCLDGQRLVLVNKALSDADYWADDAQYRTEIDSFSRITAQLTNGTRSFKVETKDGRVMTYGATSTSYVRAIVGAVNSGLTAPQPTAKSGALSWAVDRIADRAGNYVSFSYEQDGTTGEHRATFIRYGGTGLPSHAAVQFVFEGRQDAWKRYVDEARNDLRSRVASIKTYVGSNLDGDVVASGTLVRDYTLQYERSPTSGRSLLNAVQACARNPQTGVTECLPKTTFAWGKPDPSKTPGFVSKGSWPGAPILTTRNFVGSTEYSALHAEYFSFADFGNDGYADVLEKRVASPTSPANGVDVLVDDANPIPRGTLRTQYRYFHNNRSGFTQYNYTLNTGEAFAVLQVGDFDGDGAPDLHVSTAAGPKICLSPLGTAGALGAPGTTITFTCDPNRPAVGRNDVYELPYVIDVVGDGRSAHYSPIDDTTLDATLCLQSSCMVDNAPPDVLGMTYTEYGTPLFQINNYFRFEEGVDFAGTGKSAVVRWTKPHFQQYRYDEDGTRIYVNRWENKQPQVIMTGFRKPGSEYTDSSLYAYSYPTYTPSCTNASCTPYTFEGGGEAADFNGSGYSSLAFGFLELGRDANGALIYNRAELTVCLSTGRALDCGIRRKYSGATYISGGGAGNFLGDGQPTFLGLPVTQGPNGPTTSTTRHMCRVMGDDTTGGEGTNDANIACDPWAGPVLVSGRRDRVFQLDLLGTGRAQLVHYHSGYFDTNRVWQEDGRWELFEPTDLAVAGQALDRIYQVTNGVGATAAVEYVDGLPSGVVTRTNANQLTYPQRPTTGVGKIVSRLRVGNGVSADRTTSYRYQDPAIDVAGRGSLGFASVTSTDEQTGIVTTTRYAQPWPLTGMVQSSTVTSGSVVLSETTNRLSSKAIAQTYGTGTVCPFTAYSFVRRRDLNGSDLGTVTTSGVDTEDIQYDNWCNLLKTKVVSAGSAVDAAATFTTTTVNTYVAPDITHWLIGLVQRSSVTKQHSSDASSITRTTALTYETNYSGRVRTETLQPDDTTLTQRLTTTYDRSGNPFGLVNAKTVTWRDPYSATDKNRVDSTAYDANGRFPVSVTNALNHTETRVYDPGTGAQTRLTGPNNLATNWTVDGFGRATKELRADGNETRKYTKQCQGDCPAGAALAVVTDSFHGADRIAVPQVTYLDNAGHVLRTQTWGFDGRAIVADQRYDSLGRPHEADQPRYSADAAYLASRQTHDALNRVLTVTTRDEAGTERTLTNEYLGMVTTITNPKGQKRTDKRDVLGLLREVTDAKLGVTRFGYDPFGNLSRTVDPNGNVITVSYDALGRKTDLRDPDLGWIHYDVDALGQTWRQINPVQRGKGQSTRFEFDLLGRMTGRYEPDLESHWIFDTASKGIGQLAEAYTGTPSLKDYRRLHSYDALGRPSTTTQVLTDANYTSTPEYDGWSRIVKQTHQRGADAAKVFHLRYNNHGYQERIERTGLVLWQVNAQDAAQQVTQATLGNGLTQTRRHNPHTGRMESGMVQTAGQLVRLQEGYRYDALGSVERRTQYWDTNGFIEDFGYDELNRITSSQVVGQPVQSFTYDAAGNITTKTGAGTYTYPPQGASAVRPHAVQSASGIAGSFGYDDNGNLTSGAGRTATWTSFDMPVTITKGGSSSTFVYGPEHQRAKQTRNDGTVILYAGAQEVENKNGQLTVKTYWPSGVGVEIDRPAAPTELNWTHVDRLGSPVAITDSAGNLREKLAYDAWGKRRTTDGSATPDSLDGIVDNKGFTKHEMLDQLDLVHMNGRVYDPLVARFLSGDPIIQDPLNGQNYSRYTYVFNNPTNLTDPTGFAACTGTLLDKGCGGHDTKLADGYPQEKDSPKGGKSQPAERRQSSGKPNDSSGNKQADGKNAPTESAKGAASETKTHGTPQKTGSPGHDLASKAVGDAAISTGEAERVHYNQQLKTATGDPAVGTKRPDVTIVWKNGQWTLVEVVSPSQSMASQLEKGVAMNKSLEAVGVEVRKPVVVSVPDGIAGKFTFRASGVLGSLSLLGGFLDLQQAQRENPGLTLIERLHILNGTPLPQRKMEEMH